jgi:hypothetical protein
MKLELTTDQAQELENLLGMCLPDMSSEIADTDNPEYRAGLIARRARLSEIAETLSRLLATDALPLEPPA